MVSIVAGRICTTADGGHACLVADVSGNVLLFSLFRLLSTVGLLCISFIILRYVFCISSLSRAVIMKEYR